MGNLEKDATILLKEIMSNCKAERKAKRKESNKELAKALEITENYFSALESARVTPSVKLLMKYLITCGFDVEPLKALSVQDASTPKAKQKERVQLIQKIYSFDEEQIGYMLEQAKVAEVFNLKMKSKRKET